MEVIRDSDKQITLKLILEDNQSIVITLVYAKCNDIDRIDLWNDIGEDLRTTILLHGGLGELMMNCIFERLDRVLKNQMLLDGLGNMEVEHLSRTWSDRAPLLISIGVRMHILENLFKFLTFWAEHEEEFKSIVRENWSLEPKESLFSSKMHRGPSILLKYQKG
ncbi:hypothetical protein H5410_003892 [Solanum commersonii]|uniref:Uncharacterized protein n=1 Tax=Solanum commersonii TaxID=4109 RepID=A0A9J6B6Y0_SOLCO|nr:hypothetical protein H5410_003892 [Solanum commersonii]